MLLGNGAVLGKLFIDKQVQYHKNTVSVNELKDSAVQIDFDFAGSGSDDIFQNVGDKVNQDPSPLHVDYDELHATSKYAIGWLYQPDTEINYPVGQAEDNSYFIDHLLNGSYNLNGTLFLDCNNDRTFMDQNSIIYGHHMSNGAMFCGLTRYTARNGQKYYDDHPVLYLSTEQQDYRLEIVSVFVTKDQSDAYKKSFATQDSYGEWLDEMMNKSVVKVTKKANVNDNLVTLSTCSYEFADARTVVMCRMVPLSRTPA